MNKIKFSDILGIVGLLLGIPGFLLLFINSRAALGVVVLLMVIGIFWYFWDSNFRPELTLLQVRKHLKVNDTLGQTAILKHYVKFKVHCKGIAQYWFTGISSDGTIDINQIKIDNLKPDLVRTDAGQIRVCKQLPLLDRGDIFELEMELPVLDALTESEEKLIHRIAEPTKSLAIEIEFPDGRWAKTARASRGIGGSNLERRKCMPPQRWHWFLKG